MCSHKSSPHDPAIAPVMMCRQHEVAGAEFSELFRALNETEGFLQLQHGVWIYNSYLNRPILIFGVYGNLAADTPERAAATGQKAPSTIGKRGCMYCTRPRAQHLDALFSNEEPPRPDVEEFIARVQEVPYEGAPQSHDEAATARFLDVNFKSRMHDFPHAQVIRYGNLFVSITRLLTNACVLIDSQSALELLHQEFQGNALRHWDAFGRLLMRDIPLFWARISAAVASFPFADHRLKLFKATSMEAWHKYSSGHDKCHFVLIR